MICLPGNIPTTQLGVVVGRAGTKVGRGKVWKEGDDGEAVRRREVWRKGEIVNE